MINKNRMSKDNRRLQCQAKQTCARIPLLLGIASFPFPRVARVPNKFRPGVARGSAIEGDDGGGFIARVKWICHDKHKTG